MLENKAQNSSGKQALIFTKFHALTRVIKEGYIEAEAEGTTVLSSAMRAEIAILAA